jgi:heparin/heparan-sulfate lyase
MVARTGWDENSAMVEMKVNEYNFNNHQHLDAAAFQIYYKGALAIDSGVYTGSSGSYGSPHCCNYYWRSIAHNTLLIYDPQEKFRAERGYGNDGGQRLPNGRSEPAHLEMMMDPKNGYRTGTVLAHGFGPDPKRPAYSLLQGDITAAYSEKVKQVVRSSVFFNLDNSSTPAALIVFDRVVSIDPEFKKYWLLHTEQEPQVQASQIVIDNTRHGQTGRLFLNPLLPVSDSRSVQKVGGPGQEFMVFGTDYANDQTQRHIEKSSMELGGWRIEISPKSASAEDLFLNVMQITDQSNDTPFPVERLDAGDMTGCRIVTPQQNWVVLFRKDAAFSEDAVHLTLAGKDISRLLITGLESGRWQARQANGSVKKFDVNQESHCGWLELTSGEWRIEKQK